MTALSLLPVWGVAATSDSVFLEELTSPELRDRISKGTTTVLVPIGGTEQNGPHMVLGKHNARVRVIAGLIAQRLGNAVVAPVLAYVPEGAITPPEAHMRFAGTISISGPAFESLLESSAKSFKQHGFRDIIFLGDHGGYQRNEVSAAQRVNKSWGSDTSARATALTAYYDSAQKPFNAVLRSKGYSDQEIGTHAGLSDTSLALATDKTLVRTEALALAAQGGVSQGVYGDPRRSSPELGQLGVQLIVDASVRAIQDAVKLHAVP